jgi:hypothetical protein
MMARASEIKRAGLLLAAMVALSGASQGPAEYVVSGDGIVSATVNGAPARLRIEPGATAMPIVDAALAERAHLKGGMFGLRFAVGSVHLNGRTDVATLMLDGAAFKRRVAWFDRPWAAGVDGAIGPGSLPAPVVRFALHAPRPGERTVALPLVDAGGLIGNWGGLFARIDLGGVPIKVRFDLQHRDSIATAGAGLRLAQTNGAALTGPPGMTDIVFGIARPSRRMRFARPLQIGPLSLDTMLVRVGDYGDASPIPDADVVPDPDEIVVTARKKRDTSRDRLSIGLDQLERCSSIVFDKAAKRIVLSCF